MYRALRQVETESGITLFIRESKNLQLTEAGEEFARKAGAISAEYEDIASALKSYGSARAQDISEAHLFTTPLAAMCILDFVDILAPGQFDFPVNMQEIVLSSLMDVRQVISDSRGIALVTIPPSEFSAKAMSYIEETGLSYKGLFVSDVVALVSSSSPLARLPELTPDKYARWRPGAVGVACPNDPAIVAQLETIVVQDNIRLISNNVQLIKKAVRSGSVAMFLPKAALGGIHAGRGLTHIPFANDQGLDSVEFGIVSCERPKCAALELADRITEDIIRWAVQQKDATVARPCIGGESF